MKTGILFQRQWEENPKLGNSEKRVKVVIKTTKQIHYYFGYNSIDSETIVNVKV